MEWQVNDGLITFVGVGPVDMDSPVAVDQHVTLRAKDTDFEVRVTRNVEDQFEGVITCITSQGGPLAEIAGFSRGAYVYFLKAHIYTVTLS